MISLRLLSKIGYYGLILNIVSIMCFSYKSETVIISYVAYTLSSIVMLIYIGLCKKNIRLDKFCCILVVFLIWCIASNLWSININVSLTSTFTMVQLTIYGIILYEFLRCSDIDEHKLIFALGIGSLIMGIYSLIYYGITPTLDTILSGHRLGQEINQSNTFSNFAGIGCIVWFSLYLSKSKLLYLILFIFSVLLMLAGGSRGTLLTLLVCLFILLFHQHDKIRHLKMIVFVSGFLVIVIYLFHDVYSQLDVFQRLDYFFNLFMVTGGVDNSTQLRLYMIQFGFEQFLENPIIGYGLNCYSVLLAQTIGITTYSHNNFIELLCDLGSIGFGIYYWLYLSIWKKRKLMSNVIFVLILFTFLIGMFGPNYYSKILYIIFAISFSAIKHDKDGVKNENNDENN